MRSVLSFWACLFLCATSAVALGSGEDSSSAGTLKFNRDIRPILSDNCFACHGPDAEERAGGFRLDVAESATAAADSGERPIVPGDPSASEILRRISLDADDPERMPPEATHKSVTPEQLATLRQWIEEGASWQQHWSLTPPQRPKLPSVQSNDWVRNGIDHFILARLEGEGLKPSPPADRETLLRRVTFDLTGLPPTVAQLEAFLKDDSPNAYEKVVDRLLASPHYGEHMARFWLDAARYGDTHGLHLDNYREMWLYRDWVIDAFNRNLPFDEFAIEQLAGDLLENPTQDQLIATGFSRCHVTTNEGGSIKEEVHIRNVIDRVDTFSTVFLGLTMGCTRCHDHKYDPLTQQDYFSMSAYFNSLESGIMDGNKKVFGPHVKQPSEEQESKLAALQTENDALKTKFAGDWPAVDVTQQAWEARFTADVAEKKNPSKEVGLTVINGKYTLHPWQMLAYFQPKKSEAFANDFGPEKDGYLPKKDYASLFGTFNWKARLDFVDGKVNLLPIRDGHVSVTYVYRKIEATEPGTLEVSLGSDDALKVFLNGEEALAVDVRRPAAADQNKLSLKLKRGTNELLLKIVNYLGGSGFYFGVPGDASVAPPEILKLIDIKPSQRTQEQQAKVREHYRTNVASQPEVVKVRDRLTALEAEIKELEETIPTTLIWKEAAKPRQAYMLERGEYDQRGEPVERATPGVLPPLAEDLPNDRLGLALWLTDDQHPLFARVAVNRLWQQAFGIGLVKTAGDFGSQGEPPSHPELLDWLATELMQNGWDVKAFMKGLVMSATYRQFSHVTPELYAKDPKNRLLARGPRFRLDAEMLRDQALAVSGLLSDKLGGPSVKPPQPKGIWEAVAYSGSNTKIFKADKDPEKIHRRTLYTFIKRTAPAPQMGTFDAPPRESCVVVRERTNTPLQALLILNDPQYVEAARALAERVMKTEAETAAAKAATMFRLAAGRSATDEEIVELVESYQQELQHFQDNPEAAKQLTAIGAVPPPEELNREELAAWTLTANLILNLDEVVTKN